MDARSCDTPLISRTRYAHPGSLRLRVRSRIVKEYSVAGIYRASFRSSYQDLYTCRGTLIMFMGLIYTIPVIINNNAAFCCD